jgi:hypothetical protein
MNDTFTIDLETCSIINRRTGKLAAHIRRFETDEDWANKKESTAYRMLSALVHRGEPWVVVVTGIARDDYEGWEQNIGLQDSDEFNAAVPTDDPDTLLFVRTFRPECYEGYYMKQLGWPPPDMTAEEVEAARAPFRKESAEAMSHTKFAVTVNEGKYKGFVFNMLAGSQEEAEARVEAVITTHGHDAYAIMNEHDVLGVKVPLVLPARIPETFDERTIGTPAAEKGDFDLGF